MSTPVSGLAERAAGLGLKGTSFLTMHHHTPAQIAGLLDLAADIKAHHKAGVAPKLLEGRSVAMIFMKTSTRTRISFEVGISPARGPAAVPQRQRHPVARGRDDQGHGARALALRRRHHDPHLRPEGRRGPARRGLDPRHQRPHRRLAPLPGDGRPAHHPRALRRARSAPARLRRRRQQRGPLADDRRRQDRHARDRRHAGGLPAQGLGRRVGARGRRGRPTPRSSSRPTCAAPCAGPT